MLWLGAGGERKPKLQKRGTNLGTKAQGLENTGVNVVKQE